MTSKRSKNASASTSDSHPKQDKHVNVLKLEVSHFLWINKADVPSDPPFAGWARISTIKPADPRTFQMNPHLRKLWTFRLKLMRFTAPNPFYSLYVGRFTDKTFRNPNIIIMSLQCLMSKHGWTIWAVERTEVLAGSRHYIYVGHCNSSEFMIGL